MLTLLLVGCVRGQVVGIEARHDAAAGKVDADAGAALSQDAADSPPEPGSNDQDAGPGDAAAAGAGTDVSVTLLRRSAAIAGTRVIFHDVAGELLGEQRTGADGRAVSSTARMLTVAAPPAPGSPGAMILITYAGLNAGDHLVWQLPAEPSAPTLGTYEVRWEGSSPFLTLQIGGCGGTSWSSDKPSHLEHVAMTRECVDRAQRALATNESDNDMGHSVNGFLSASSLPALQNGMAALQLSNTHEAQFVELATLPTGGSLSGATGFVGSEAFRLPVHTAPWSSSQPKVGFPAGFLQTLVLRVALPDHTGPSVPLTRRELARKFSPQAGVRTIDFSGAIGSIASAALEPQTGARSKLSWEATGNLVRADQVVVGLEWPGGQRWLIVFPANASAFTLPALPADLAPTGTPKLRSLVFSDHAALADYAALKAKAQTIPASVWTDAWMSAELGPVLDGPQEWDRASWLDGTAFPAATCNALPEPTVSVPLQYATSAAPLATGGMIRDGLYRLEQMVVYANEPRTTIEGRSEILEIKGSTWQRVAYYDGTPTLRFTQNAVLQGSDYQVQRVCGDARSATLLAAVPSDGGQYSAAQDLLSLIIPAHELNSARAVFTYRRSASADPTCKFDCEAGIAYTVVGLATGLARYTLNKVDSARDRCTRITLVVDAQVPGFSTITTPPRLRVESAWTSPRAADCASSGGPAAADVIPANAGEGSIQNTKTGDTCALDADLTLRFDPESTGLPREQRFATKGVAWECLPGL